MEKGGVSKVLIIFVGVLLAALAGGGVAYYTFIYSPGNVERVALKNPTDGLSDEEAVAKFDESFVAYILYALGADKLHNPPFSSDTPKINFYIGEVVYNAEVVKGKINVGWGEVVGEDASIRTSTLDAVKMIRDRNYIVQSFREGNSGFELSAGKMTLLAKGYLKFYTETTGEEITGSVIDAYNVRHK